MQQKPIPDKCPEGHVLRMQKDKELTQYNNPFLYEIPETIQTQKLHDALVKTVQAHPFLKLKLKLLGNGEVVSIR